MNSRLLICLLAAVILLGSILFGPSAYRKGRARYHLRAGLTAYAAKDYREAEKQFLLAKGLDEKLIDAQVGLVRVYNLAPSNNYLLKPDADFARRRLEAVSDLLRLDPANRYALAVMADWCLAAEDRSQAKRWWRQWASAYPSDHEPLYLIAVANYEVVHDDILKHGEAELIDAEHRAELTALADEGIAALKESIQRKHDNRDAFAYLVLLCRERANLAGETAERKQWLREADLTAQAAARMRKRE